jgi:hypothetical protein
VLRLSKVYERKESALSFFFFFHSECVTIGSTAVRVYQVNYLKNHRIGLIGEEALVRRTNQSKLAFRFMDYLTHTRGYEIRNRQSGEGEMQCGSYYIDGLISNYGGENVDDEGLLFFRPGHLALSINGCYYVSYLFLHSTFLARLHAML